MLQLFLLKIIQIIHLILILLILLSPFFNKQYLLYSILINAFILYKWKIDGSCLLTKLEYILFGETKEEQGFIYRLINPIFNIKEDKLQNILDIFLMIWIIFLIIIYIAK